MTLTAYLGLLGMVIFTADATRTRAHISQVDPAQWLLLIVPGRVHKIASGAADPVASGGASLSNGQSRDYVACHFPGIATLKEKL